LSRGGSPASPRSKPNLKLKFNPEFDYLVQLVFVQRFPLLGPHPVPRQRLPGPQHPGLHRATPTLAPGPESEAQRKARRPWPLGPSVAPEPAHHLPLALPPQAEPSRPARPARPARRLRARPLLHPGYLASYRGPHSTPTPNRFLPGRPDLHRQMRAGYQAGISG